MNGAADIDPSAVASGGLYVHVPFCDAKCGYCDFYSVRVKDADIGSLMSRLARELADRIRASPFDIQTIFVGGGTPTILPTQHLAGLLGAIRRTVSLDAVAEFTVEANPATVDDAKAELLVQGGVTRVSLGAQSFVDAELAVLERRHRPDDVATSIEVLRRHGIGQIGLDLIFGIPGQTIESWAGSLRRAIALDPDHMSCYGLTYESGTRLTALRDQGRLRLCEEHLEADMYLHAIDTLAETGYEQYETSNFAKPGRRCRHNLIYWHNGPYIGVGPSASGYVDERRYKNVADIDAYIRLMDMQGHAEAESEWIDTPTLITEMILMQLRLTEGLSIQAFRERTGADPVARFGDTLKRLVDLGLAAVSDTHIVLTRPGRLVSDSVMVELAAAATEHGAA